MRISFDYDFTLSVPKIQNLCRLLNKYKEIITDEDVSVFIITSRFESNLRGVYELAKELGISRDHVYATNNVDKYRFINDNNLNIDIHFDDDFFEIDRMNNDGKTLGVLIELDLHPKTNPEE